MVPTRNGRLIFDREERRRAAGRLTFNQTINKDQQVRHSDLLLQNTSKSL